MPAPGPLTTPCIACIAGGHVHLYYLSGGQFGNTLQNKKCTGCQQVHFSNPTIGAMDTIEFADGRNPYNPGKIHTLNMQMRERIRLILMQRNLQDTLT